MIVLMRFVYKFGIEINYYYGKFVVSLFKRSISREIKRFNKVCSKFLTLNRKYMDVGRLAIMLAFDGPEGVDRIREDGLILELYLFLFIFGYSVSFL